MTDEQNLSPEEFKDAVLTQFAKLAGLTKKEAKKFLSDIGIRINPEEKMPRERDIK